MIPFPPFEFGIRTALLLLVLIGVAPLAHSQSALHYRSFGNDWVGLGQTLEAREPQWSFSATHTDGKWIRITIAGSDTTYQLELESNTGSLSPGSYEGAYRTAFRGPSHGIDFGGAGRGCDGTGRFVVLAAEYGPGNEVVRFAANFAHRCGLDRDPLFGEVRFNSSVPLSIDVAAPDSHPDEFALISQSPVAPSALVESNWVTVQGVNQPLPISVVGGEYSVNRGPFTAAPGTVQLYDQIIVRAIASSAAGDSKHADLSIGDRTARLSVQTYLPGMALSGLYFRSPPGEFIGQGSTRLFMTPHSAVSSSRTTSASVEFRIQGPEGNAFTLNVAGPESAPLRIGTYEGTISSPFQFVGPNLQLSGNGNGCGDRTGRFAVLEAVYGTDGSVESFAANFEQRCNLAQKPLVGEIRFNSAIPFGALAQTPCAAADVTNCTADISVHQNNETPLPGAGRDIVLTTTIENLGNDTAYRVLSTFDVFSATVIWSSPGCIPGRSPLQYVCTLDAMAAGTSTTIKLVVRTNSGGIASRAEANSVSRDLGWTNNTAESQVIIAAAPASAPIPRYRLYSPVTLEHHFTTDLNEYTVLGTNGNWVQEGTVGKVLDNPGSYGGVAAVPYYRLYDTSTRWHHWTTDANEYYTLTQYPHWNAEGVDGYILPSKPTGTTELYRLTYPFIPGLHHWTIDPVEYGELIGKYGWVGEPGAGFVIQ